MLHCHQCSDRFTIICDDADAAVISTTPTKSRICFRHYLTQAVWLNSKVVRAVFFFTFLLEWNALEHLDCSWNLVQ